MSSTGIPTTAERRYRRLLRLLPPWYRERYTEEMVEVYLAGAPGDQARPGAAEIAATLRLALTTRARRLGRPSGATLLLVAVVGSAVLAAGAGWRAALGFSFLLAREPSWQLGGDGRLVAVEPSVGLGSAVDARALAWVLVLGLLLLAMHRSATVVAALVAALDVGAAFSPFLSPSASILEIAIARTDARSAVLPIVIVAALVLTSTRGAGLGRRPRVVAAVGTLAALAVGYTAVRTRFVDAAGGGFWTLLAVAVAVAAVVVLLTSRRLDPTWPATVLILAVLVVLAGPLPAGSLYIGGGVERTVTDGPWDPALVPGLTAGVIAVVLAAVAWLAATGHQPEHPAPTGRREELVTG